MAFIYRDTKTGRFVKESTWKRSKAQGGSRYKRKNVPRGTKKRTPAPISPSTPVLQEYVIVGGYDRIQIHIVGPPGMSRSEVIQNAYDWSKNVRLPPEVTVRSIKWDGGDEVKEDEKEQMARLLKSGGAK